MRSCHQSTRAALSSYKNTASCGSTNGGNDNENTTKESATNHRHKKTPSSSVGMVTGDKKLAAVAEYSTVLPLHRKTNVKGCEIHCKPSYPPTIKGKRGRSKALELAWKISEHRECRGESTIEPVFCVAATASLCVEINVTRKIDTMHV